MSAATELKMIGFDAVMRDVERHVAALLVKREWTPVVAGEPIAWAVCDRGGCTDSLSDVHRVGEPKKDDPYTTCGVPIPAPVQWLSLSPALIEKGLTACRFCESLSHSIATVAA